MSADDMRNYTFPGRFRPRQSQKETAAFLAASQKAFCLDAMGTGKTLSALWAMDYLMQKGEIRRTLIITPLNLCDHVWGKEVWLSFIHRRYAFLRGNRKQKNMLVADLSNEILIVNPESLHLIKSLPQVDLIIVDEFTKFKNVRTRKYKALKMISEGRRLWMLSGTPAPQSPLDAYAPIRLVRPERLSFLAWRDWTMKQVSRFVWEPRPNAAQVISKWMQPAIRHTMEECFDIPDVSIVPLEVDLTAEQKKAIESFRKDAIARFEKEKVITATNAAAVLSKCLQAMSGCIYGEEGGEPFVQKIDATPYYDAIEGVVEQADTPVLIFVPFRAAALHLHNYLVSLQYKVGLIMGDTPLHERTEYFNAVQNKKLHALVAVAGTMSHGLTLTGARYVLWALPPYSFEEYEQANARVIRPGQTGKVVIYQLIQNNISKMLFNRLQTREKLQKAVLKLIEKGGE